MNFVKYDRDNALKPNSLILYNVCYNGINVPVVHHKPVYGGDKNSDNVLVCLVIDMGEVSLEPLKGQEESDDDFAKKYKKFERKTKFAPKLKIAGKMLVGLPNMPALVVSSVCYLKYHVGGSKFCEWAVWCRKA